MQLLLEPCLLNSDTSNPLQFVIKNKSGISMNVLLLARSFLKGMKCIHLKVKCVFWHWSNRFSKHSQFAFDRQKEIIRS